MWTFHSLHSHTQCTDSDTHLIVLWQSSASLRGVWTLYSLHKWHTLIYTVNIREVFVHFKSHLLKLRRQCALLCCLLEKIRAFLPNWSVLCCHFRRVLYKRGCHSCFLCHSNVRYSHKLCQVQILLSGTVQEVYIAITQYPEVLPLPKLEVLLNFRVGQ